MTVRVGRAPAVPAAGPAARASPADAPVADVPARAARVDDPAAHRVAVPPVVRRARVRVARAAHAAAAAADAAAPEVSSVRA